MKKKLIRENISEKLVSLRPYGPVLLRYGIALVFLYFGISQLQHPVNFIGWLPPEASLLPFTPYTLVVLNGAFEVIAGTLLLLGLFTRISALLLGLHLLGITIIIGFTLIGVRDFGLSVATLAVVLNGPDKLCLSEFFKRKSTSR